MDTRIDAAPLLDSTTIMAGYVLVLGLVLVLGGVMVGLHIYRNQLARRREITELSTDLSEAVWPATAFPEANARFAAVLRSTKTNDLAATLLEQLGSTSRAKRSEHSE